MREKLLPQNIEAECGVLGSIIIDAGAVTEVADFLHASDFYRETHGMIYAVILHLYARREPADFITICDELERRQQLEQVGGAGYITSLVNQVPTSGHVAFYGRIVERTAILRKLAHAAGQIAAIAYEEGDADAALAHAEQIIFALGQGRGARDDFSSIQQVLSEYLHDLDALHGQHGHVVGIPSGMDALDGIIGGLQDSDLVLLAARPSNGKTSLALTLAEHAALTCKKRVGIFSLEMSKKQLAQRFVAMTSQINLQKLRTAWLEEADWGRVIDAVDTLSEGKLWIADTTGLTITSLCSKCRRLKAQHGLDLLVVDHLQLMQGTGNENRVQELSDISRGLKLLAVELDIPILALSQLSRKVEERQIKVPILSDLRDSGSLEQDADIVLFIYRDEYYNPKSARKGIADIIIAKHRNGPVGEISLGFEKTQARFYNLLVEVPA